jgi:ribonucleotide monophosphatase NagD (HAD superfamily)
MDIVSRLLYRPYYILSESALRECKTEGDQSTEDQPYDAVVVGLAPTSLDYAHLNEAFRILSLEHPSQSHMKNSDKEAKVARPPLIVTHRAKVIGDKDGALSLGPGHFVRLLEQAADVEAEIVGKPSEGFFRMTIGSMRLPQGEDSGTGRIAIIGDDIEADLGGAAVELGLWRVLGGFFSCYLHP